jgi:WD40 repeat protein
VEALYLVCGARRPQLKRNPLGGAHVIRRTALVSLLFAFGCRPHATVREDGHATNPTESIPRLQIDSQLPIVRVDRGDVWIRLPADTVFRRITTVGLVREAVLSVDSRWVGYVSDTPGDTVQGGSGPVPATEIWLIRVEGSGARRLVRGHDTSINDHIGDFHTLRFSPDGKRLYFSSEAAAVTDAVHVVTTASGQESLVCLGELNDVVPSGRYAGDLILGQHRYYGDTPGSYDVGGLFTPDCQQIKELAVDSEGTGYDSIDAFYERFVPGHTLRRATRD